MTDTDRRDRPSLTRRWARWRDRLREHPAADLAYRVGVGVAGVLVLAVGVLAIPYPGPGWAIVFLGLGILATEFDWARRLLSYVRRRYDAVMAWFKRQGLWVQMTGAVFTAAIVVATLWLMGVLDFAGEFVHVEHDWLDSPIGIGA